MINNISDVLESIKEKIKNSTNGRDFYAFDNSAKKKISDNKIELLKETGKYILRINGIGYVEGADAIKYARAIIFISGFSNVSSLPKSNLFKKGFSESEIKKLSSLYKKCVSQEDYANNFLGIDSFLKQKVGICARESFKIGEFINGDSWPKNTDQMSYISTQNGLELISIERGSYTSICKYSDWQSCYISRCNYWLNLI